KAIHLSELKISLYVDLDNLSNLVLKSVYTIDNRQITGDFVKNNAALSNQYLAYASALRDFGYESDEVVKDEELINKFLTSDLSFLNNYCTLYLSDSLKNRQTMSYQQFHIQATSDANWLEIQVSNTQYTNEELADILRAYHKKKKFYKFHDTVIYLDDSLEKINEIAKDFSLDNSFKQKVKLPLYQVFKLPGIKENGFDVNYDDALKDIIGNIKDFKQADFVPSTSYLSSMRPYQVAGYKWLNVLKKHSLSGILADDMGLGKTLETISFISDLNDHKPVLIVTPKSLIFNWGKEFQKWNPVIVPTLINGEKNERVKIISTIRNDCKAIYITSYDSLRIDVDSYKDKNFSLVILDEAQYIKNAFALKTKAVKSISSDSRLVLTGTPIENSLADLWSIFDFLMPGYLLSYRDFSKTYTGDISKNPDKVQEKNRLIAKITPFVLRRTKKEVLKDLPPKTIETRYVELNDKQRAVYDATLLKARNELGDDGTSRMNTLAALTRMREICLDPSMFLDNFTELSAKLDITLSIIQEAIASNHKLIVFSSFTRALDHLRKLLNDINIPSQSITGDTKAEERVEIAENFNTRDDYSIILVSLKAGGTGLNLVGGDIVIHLNPWWNLAAEDQATDRAYRIGQKNKVTVIKLVAKNTIEEKVIDLQNSKKDLSDSIIKTGDQGITALSEETIRYLLS
ncbi:MAG: SNF2-related protein, partial [Bacilli bacterium]